MDPGGWRGQNNFFHVSCFLGETLCSHIWARPQNRQTYVMRNPHFTLSGARFAENSHTPKQNTCLWKRTIIQTLPVSNALKTTLKVNGRKNIVPSLMIVIIPGVCAN